MKKEQVMTAETLAYARQVYTPMHGFYKAGTVPGCFL